MATGRKRNTLQLEIIRFIKQYITEHELKPGDKLPSQEQLINMIGVSRTSLREAVKTMEAQGKLKVLNGKGIYVADEHANALQITLDVTQEKEELLELVEIRRMLEREILRMVVTKATDAEMEELNQVKNVLLAKYYRGERQTEEDYQFHSMIYEMAHNRNMEKIITVIRDALDVFWSFTLSTEMFTDTIPLHGELYEALAQRNVKKAQLINDEILNGVCQDIQNML